MVIEVVDDRVVEILRRKTPGQRLAMACDMWRCASDRLRCVLRAQYPDWSQKQLRMEFQRRMLGSD
jgi:hypothetical protein